MPLRNNFVRGFFCLALAAALSSATSAVELTNNGDLETGDTTGWTIFPNGASNTAAVSISSPSTGVYSLELINNTANTAIVAKQANLGIGTVTAGQTVDISFDARGTLPVGGVAFAEFFSELVDGGTSAAEILGSGPVPISSSWQTFTYSTTTGFDVSGGVTLQLTATNGGTPGTTVYYDNVSVSVVPEPAAFCLLGLAGLGLVSIRRKRS